MKVGIQLFSVRLAMKKDPLATIKAVADKGYRYIEVANHQADQDNGVGFGVGASEIKKVLEDTGAQIFSAHIFPFTPEIAVSVIKYHETIGTKYIAHPLDFFKDYDEVLRKSEMMNKVGEIYTNAGITFMYHNHFHEFQIFKGKTIMDIMAENTDPKYVHFELDTYWTLRGGQDPVETLKKFGTRVRLIHQKDFPAEYQDKINLIDPVHKDNIEVTREYFRTVVDPKTFTEIGTGILPIQDYINTGNAVCKSDYIILEQDHSLHDELESISISMESFRKFQGIEW